jgi:hypothetical protein
MKQKTNVIMEHLQIYGVLKHKQKPLKGLQQLIK